MNITNMIFNQKSRSRRLHLVYSFYKHKSKKQIKHIIYIYINIHMIQLYEIQSPGQLLLRKRQEHIGRHKLLILFKKLDSHILFY